MSLPDWNADLFAAAAPVLDEWISVYALPPELAYGLVAWESKFNPRAFLMDRNGGSVGLCQISLPTARGLGYSGAMGSASDLSGLFAPDVNVQYGLLDLRNQLDRYNGDWTEALSAYNAGTAIAGNLAAYVDNVMARVSYFLNWFGSADFLGTPAPGPDTTGMGTPLPPDAGSTDPLGLVLLAGVLAAGAAVVWRVARR